MKIIQTVVLTVAMLVIPILTAAIAPAHVQAATCGGVEVSILQCDKNQTEADKSKKPDAPVEDTGVWKILILVLNIMTGMVALAAVGGIVYASILYATAEDKSAQVQQAKEKIFGVVVGLVLFAGMYAILQFLIPGGIF
jgi:hypothetical protein